MSVKWNNHIKNKWHVSIFMQEINTGNTYYNVISWTLIQKSCHNLIPVSIMNDAQNVATIKLLINCSYLSFKQPGSDVYHLHLCNMLHSPAASNDCHMHFCYYGVWQILTCSKNMSIKPPGWTMLTVWTSSCSSLSLWA